MARALRVEYAGAFYHIASRGNERKNVFLSARDREQFLSYLESATVRYGACIHLYCLMSNHYHLLVETPLGNLSQIMGHINGAYTTYFNVKRRRSGHLFQGRYKAILVDKDEYGLELSRYIHLNPVRAGLVETPGQYKWSSYRAYTGLAPAPQWLHMEFMLSQFRADKKMAQKRYRNFVEQLAGGSCPNPFDSVSASTLLGANSFIEWVQENFLKDNPKDRELPALRKLAARPSLETIRTRMDTQFADDCAMARRVGLYLCRRLTGLKLKEIGAAYGVGESAVTQASRRVAESMKHNQSMRNSVEILENVLRMSRV